ncbi:MAG: hypothetical protein RLZZ247_1651, partial [Cyanobacteriota bacterium]
ITTELQMPLRAEQFQLEQLQSRAHLTRHGALVHRHHLAHSSLVAQPEVVVENREMLER